MSKKQTSIDLDDATREALEELKTALGVKTNAAVIRKALSITRYMASQANENHSVTIEGKNEEKTNIVFAA